MGWSTAFTDLIQRRAPLLGAELVSWSVIDGPDGVTFSGIDTIATHSGGGRPVIVEIEVSGDDVDPYDTSASTLGEWAVIVVIGEFAELSPINPGTLVRLDVFDLARPTVRETVQIGIVHGVEQLSDAMARIRVRGALSILGSRHTDTAESLALGAPLADTERSEALAWTPGDAQLLCDAVAGFRTETGGDGVVRVTPHADNTAGTDVFYLRWTGTTGTAFDLDTGHGALDTTAIALDASLVHDVGEVVFIEDHPLRVAAKVLISTGTGYDDYDTLPSGWGFGIPRDLVDVADMEYWAAQSSPATGSDKWQIWADAEQTNPADWLISALAQGGWWLTMRQGRITGRALVPVADRPALAEVEITDDDLIAWTSIEAFDGASDVGAKQARAIGPTVTGTLTEAITKFPAERYSDFDVAQYAHANETEWVAEIAERLGPWRLRQSERRVGRFVGLRLAQLAPGSVVLLTVSGVGRLAPYDRRVALVTRVSPIWLGSEVEVTLLIQPTYQEPPGTTINRP